MSGATLRGAWFAELLKLRGTLAAWMCLVAPALVVGVLVLQFCLMPLGERPVPPAAAAWESYLKGVLGLWAFLMLPLYITLQAALLAALEHGNRQWKHLFSLAVPRWHHYAAKAVAMAALVAAANLILLVLAPLGGWLLGEARPALGIAGPAPWAFLFARVGAILAASGLMMALQLWIALRWSSFTVAVGAGMAATVAGFLVGQSERFGQFYPWSMPMATLVGDGERLQALSAAGAAGGLLVGLYALALLLRRDPE